MCDIEIEGACCFDGLVCVELTEPLCLDGNPGTVFAGIGSTCNVELTMEAGGRNFSYLTRGMHGRSGQYLMFFADGHAAMHDITIDDLQIPHLKQYYPHIVQPPITSDFAMGSPARLDDNYRLIVEAVTN
ncbi:MAG: hypothetical protein AAGI30_13610 [Planctomycetota bacterium]